MVLEDIFATVLRLSFYGMVGGGVVLVCTLINYVRAPRWISMALWGLLGLRLVLPFSFSSAVSVFRVQNLSEKIEYALDFEGTYSGDYKAAGEGSARYEAAVAAGSPVETQANGDRMAYYYERENGRIEPAKTVYETLLPIGARVWLAGMALLWLWAAVSYIRLRHRLRFSIRISKGVYETDAVSSPCVVGILRPRIYLLPYLTQRQRKHILLHERMHIRYLDHIWKPVSFLIISVHWFNPFLWLLYRLFQGELEMACDERVLARIGEEKRADYSESLLAMAAPRSWGRKWRLPTPIAFGENNIKERIRRILAWRKPLAVVSVLVVLLAAAACAVFLTMPENAAEHVPEEEALPLHVLGAEQEEASDSLVTGMEPLQGDLPEAEPDTMQQGTVPDAEQEPDLTEVYEELNDNGVIYQARWGGIYRRDESGADEELIYEGLAGTNPMLTVFEGRLYFKTDSGYREGALDWEDNAIRWIDLETLATGDLSLVRRDGLISEFNIRDGLITVRYAYPDVVDVLMLYVDEDTAFGEKSITQLSQQEADLLGMQVRQSVLQNPRTLVNISNRVRSQNRAYLDMDGDGAAEEILLEPRMVSDDPFQGSDTYPILGYRLQVDGREIGEYEYNLANTLWALSLDGQNILLVLYDDGPSWDPYTYFYGYRDGRIYEAGGFEEDVRMCEISPDGRITGTLRMEIVQTDWIEVQWRLGADGRLEEIPQEVYDFRNRNWVELYEELPLHPAIGGAQTFSVAPQKVCFLQTSADWSWILIETEDGQQGWVHLEEFQVVELQKNVMDVFGGLYLAG
ncbi:MAG: M56 family metallopeptidase [Roseburia sp.]|nr:M56 family metallopeptidase [Roseburia sp.]